MISLFERTENIVGKRENAGNQHFLLSPQCFQKLYISKSLKAEIVWLRFKLQNGTMKQCYYKLYDSDKYNCEVLHSDQRNRWKHNGTIS